MGRSPPQRSGRAYASAYCFFLFNRVLLFFFLPVLLDPPIFDVAGRSCEATSAIHYESRRDTGRKKTTDTCHWRVCATPERPQCTRTTAHKRASDE